MDRADSEGFSGEPNLLPVNSFNERLLNFINHQGLLTWALLSLSIYFKNFRQFRLFPLGFTP